MSLLPPPAPIILFVYNRLEHTKQTLAALQKNTGASESELFIYSDAAKNSVSEAAVTAVRAHIQSISGFKQVTIIEREHNFGLADSIVDGVSTVIKKFGRAIILEDDIVTSPHFLSYMNDALTVYEDTPEVMHVSGYFFPLTPAEAASLPETFFYNQTSCWGWGTWARAWEKYRSNASDLLHDIQQSGRLREFDMDGQFRFSSTLRANAQGRQKTWAIKWHASVFLERGLCLHPRFSLTKNIGHDGSGVHGKEDNKYDDPNFLPTNHVTLIKTSLFESLVARALAIRFLRQLRPTLFSQLKHFLHL